MDQISGLCVKQKSYYQQALHIQVHQMASLPKKQISWTFGLTPGSSHEGVLREREELTFPADMYLEGSDQYRGWFNSSITTSVAINGVAPYKSIISQGWFSMAKAVR